MLSVFWLHFRLNLSYRYNYGETVFKGKKEGTICWDWKIERLYTTFDSSITRMWTTQKIQAYNFEIQMTSTCIIFSLNSHMEPVCTWNSNNQFGWAAQKLIRKKCVFRQKVLWLYGSRPSCCLTYYVKADPFH